MIITSLIIGGGLAYIGAAIYKGPQPKRKASHWFGQKRLGTTLVSAEDKKRTVVIDGDALEGADEVLFVKSSSQETAVTVLSTSTAVIHLVLGYQLSTPLFILNGIGFIGLLTTHYFSPALVKHRDYTRGALAGYSAVTIAAYFIKRGTGGLSDVVGLVTKLIELGIISSLWLEREELQLDVKTLTPSSVV